MRTFRKNSNRKFLKRKKILKPKIITKMISPWLWKTELPLNKITRRRKRRG
jgi:hypothetical protein